MKVDPKTHALSYDDAQYVIGTYDRNALEAGAQLAEQNGGSLTALSVSANANLQGSRKDVLSRGASDLTVVIDEKLASADSLVTASVLGAAIKKKAPVDIVVCGEGSGDLYAQQTGPRIARELGWPVVTGVGSVRVEGDKVLATRKLEDGNETVECPMPLVIAMAGGCNSPRIPSLKNIMAAGKKPFEVLNISDLDLEDGKLCPAVVHLKTMGNSLDRKQVVIEDEVPAAVVELVRLLVQDGSL